METEHKKGIIMKWYEWVIMMVEKMCEKHFYFKDGCNNCIFNLIVEVDIKQNEK